MSSLRRENKVLRRERDFAQTSLAWQAAAYFAKVSHVPIPKRQIAFISTKPAHYPVRWMCRLLWVSSSGYYAWRGRSSPECAKRDGQLAVKIKAIFDKFDSRHGSPRILDELLADGERVSRKRVIRFMHEQDLCPRFPNQFKRTTDSAHHLPVAKNLVDRDFSPDAPGKLWASDITYIRTWEGWVYLAVVIDLFSRRVVGWSMANHMRTELPLDALKMAASGRSVESGLVHPSDRGSQYASDEYQEFLELHGITCSMSRKGNCWDNAVVESFFATLKNELTYRHGWPTRSGVIAATNDFINRFYNHVRRHSALGRMVL